MEVIKLGFGDAQEMSALYGRCFPDQWAPAFFVKKLRGTCVAYGAREGADLRGFLLLQVIEGEGEILTFCVVEECRGRGLGKKILRNTLQLSKTTHCFLEVRADNRSARRLYEAAGFLKKGLRKGYYKDCNGEAQDAIIYVYTKKTCFL